FPLGRAKSLGPPLSSGALPRHAPRPRHKKKNDKVGGALAAGFFGGRPPENRGGRRSLVGPSRRAATAYGGPPLRFGPIPARHTRAGPLEDAPRLRGRACRSHSAAHPAFRGSGAVFCERGTSTCANTISSNARHSERGFIRKSPTRSSARSKPEYCLGCSHGRAARPSPC